MAIHICILVAAAAGSFQAGNLSAADEAQIDFRTSVAPILQQHCLGCHGAVKDEGSLRLDGAAAIVKGGISGAVLIAGEPDRSELIRRLRSDDKNERMPQGTGPLTKLQIELIETWIEKGAAWPEGFVIQPPKKADSAGHWSFQPIRRPVPPPVQGESDAANGIDAFVLQRLRQEAIAPSPAADKVTLIRRVTLDLTGLPPTPAEVDAYLADDAPDSYERLVDRLLASPHYGERWARPWLDLCHYADTDGYLTDQLRPVAWRYRKWLVDALNANQPFDRFTVEQLAGDLLADATARQQLATGFLRQTLSNREGGAEPEEFRVKQVVGRAEMVGTIWLGLTVGCARCHDHKYDAISQREFFELYACLNNADEINIDAPLPEERDAWLASRPEYERRRRELVDPQRAEIDSLQQQWEAKLLFAWKNPGQDAVWDRQWELLGLVWGRGLGEGQLEGVEIVKLDWSERSIRQKDDLLDYFVASGSIVDPERFKELNLSGLRSRLEALKKEYPQATRAPVMRAAQTPRETWVHERGEFRDRGPVVTPATLACLPAWQPAAGEDPRLILARWLVSRDNPLTARVVVNRMWQEFFGRGLVLTTEDFGTRGEPPSHPDLLDWLAGRFIDSGWDVKQVHRLIVTSAAYRRSSEYRDDLATRDPGNILLARQNALRVPAEAVRDMGLAASGLLYQKMHGPSVKPPQPERVTMEAFGYNDWKPSPPPESHRRGLYTFVIRTAPFAQSVTFDAPNPNEICTRRVRSNTPLQALTLLNDPVFYEMAQALAKRVQDEAPGDDAAKIDYAFRLCLARSPSEAERNRLVEYLAAERSAIAGTAARGPITGDDSWTNLCSVLLNLHEFVTRD